MENSLLPLFYNICVLSLTAQCLHRVSEVTFKSNESPGTAHTTYLGDLGSIPAPLPSFIPPCLSRSQPVSLCLSTLK